MWLFHLSCGSGFRKQSVSGRASVVLSSGVFMVVLSPLDGLFV